MGLREKAREKEKGERERIRGEKGVMARVKEGRVARTKGRREFECE